MIELPGPPSSAAAEDVGGSGRLIVTGYVSPPHIHRGNRRDISLFVNGRPVHDPSLIFAIVQAYHTMLPSRRFPIALVMVHLPPALVDVNVHPAKSEVRFLRAAAVHDFVRDAILAAHGEGRAFTRLAAPAGAVSEPAPGFTIGGGLAARAGAGGAVAAGGDAGIPAAAEAAAPVAGPGDHLSAAAPAPLFDAVAVAPLAQFRDSYILASAPDGLVIVDQHAAHERVLYERLMDEAESRGVERQRLLFPLTLEVSAAERQACEEAAEDLARMGLGVAPYGDGAVLVDESPAIVPAGRLERLVRDLLHEVLEWPRAEGVARLRHRMAATAACHAAVTANHPLDGGRMRRIVEDLLRTRQPMTCPHGRPVLLRLSLAALEKEFRRR
jgi:DNA mismatch repair protein MutL